VSSNNQYLVNSGNHSINTRESISFHLLQASLAIYQKGVYYLGFKIFNNRSSEIKNVSDNPKKVKTALKSFYVQIPSVH
jgi:hypothetical protein